jgi:hypothetical protein
MRINSLLYSNFFNTGYFPTLYLDEDCKTQQLKLITHLANILFDNLTCVLCRSNTIFDDFTPINKNQLCLLVIILVKITNDLTKCAQHVGSDGVRILLIAITILSKSTVVFTHFNIMRYIIISVNTAFKLNDDCILLTTQFLSLAVNRNMYWSIEKLFLDKFNYNVNPDILIFNHLNAFLGSPIDMSPKELYDDIHGQKTKEIHRQKIKEIYDIF